MEIETIQKILKNNYGFVDKAKNFLPSQQRKNTKKDWKSVIEIYQKMKKFRKIINICQTQMEKEENNILNITIIKVNFITLPN